LRKAPIRELLDSGKAPANQKMSAPRTGKVAKKVRQPGLIRLGKMAHVHRPDLLGGARNAAKTKTQDGGWPDVKKNHAGPKGKDSIMNSSTIKKGMGETKNCEPSTEGGVTQKVKIWTHPHLKGQYGSYGRPKKAALKKGRLGGIKLGVGTK